ncbi:hypothetical protein BD289DRAFT_424644 [Coniella lustricola]|uniref:Uncharacterized protein n=1 Tax=Coniella lustricola TaxID=2025994 RepID=A0A2T3AI63_9PEZI|nr:hypothetical protein BD289DRAFT_424644 [Coniella lustricola]
MQGVMPKQYVLSTTCRSIPMVFKSGSRIVIRLSRRIVSERTTINQYHSGQAQEDPRFMEDKLCFRGIQRHPYKSSSMATSKVTSEPVIPVHNHTRRRVCLCRFQQLCSNFEAKGQKSCIPNSWCKRMTRRGNLCSNVHFASQSRYRQWSEKTDVSTAGKSISIYVCTITLRNETTEHAF